MQPPQPPRRPGFPPPSSPYGGQPGQFGGQPGRPGQFSGRPGPYGGQQGQYGGPPQAQFGGQPGQLGGQAGPYGDGYLQPPMPPQPAPPNRKAKFWAIGGVGAVLVVALVVLLAVQPWKSSGNVRTFELDRAITVDVQIPDGWTARQVTAFGDQGVWIVPSSETRSLEEASADQDRLRDGASAPPVHMVVIGAQTCESGATSSWDVMAVDDAAQVVRLAQRRLRNDDCVVVVGADTDKATPVPTASDVVKSMIDADAVQARVDSSRPSIRPSS